MNDENPNAECRTQNEEFRKDIHERSFEFACCIVRFHCRLTRMRGTNRIAANQLLRAGTSVGANLEEAKAAQSRPDFIAKTRISLKEARESYYWLRLIEATETVVLPDVHDLVEEANQIVAVLTTIVKNASSPRKDMSAKSRESFLSSSFCVLRSAFSFSKPRLNRTCPTEENLPAISMP